MDVMLIHESASCPSIYPSFHTCSTQTSIHTYHLPSKKRPIVNLPLEAPLKVRDRVLLAIPAVVGSNFTSSLVGGASLRNCIGNVPG